MTINDALTQFCRDLAADGVPAPLTQPFTLAALWHDLCALAGEDLPADVRALVEAPAAVVGTEDAA